MNIYKHKVQYYETDKMGVVHHSNYIRWMEEARVDFLSQIGWDYEKVEELGIVSPVTAIDCKYVQSTIFGNVISIDVWVEEFRGIKLKIKYEMKNENEVLVCEGRSEHCFLNSEGQLLNLKREYQEIFEALVGAIR